MLARLQRGLSHTSGAQFFPLKHSWADINSSAVGNFSPEHLPGAIHRGHARMKCPRVPGLAQPQGRPIWGSFRKKASFWARASSSPALAHCRRLLFGTKKCFRKRWLTHLCSFLTRRRNPLLKTCQSLECGYFSQVQKSTICGRKRRRQTSPGTTGLRGTEAPEQLLTERTGRKEAESLRPEFMAPQARRGLSPVLWPPVPVALSLHGHFRRSPPICGLGLDSPGKMPTSCPQPRQLCRRHRRRPHLLSAPATPPPWANPPSFREQYGMGFPSLLALTPVPSSPAPRIPHLPAAPPALTATSANPGFSKESSQFLVMSPPPVPCLLTPVWMLLPSALRRCFP